MAFLYRASMKSYLAVLATLSVVVIGVTFYAAKMQGLMAGIVVVSLMWSASFLVSQTRKYRQTPSTDEFQDFEPNPRPQRFSALSFSRDTQESDFDEFSDETPNPLTAIFSQISGLLKGFSMPSLDFFSSNGGDLDFLEGSDGGKDFINTIPSNTVQEESYVEEIPPKRTISKKLVAKKEETVEPIDPLIAERIKTGIIPFDVDVAITPLGDMFDMGWLNRIAIADKFE